MPKATFDEFVQENPMYQSWADNRDARRVFDILNEDAAIYDAIRVSPRKPALMPNVEKIENFIDSLGDDSTFDLSVNLSRQGVGNMVRTILAPFGYTPIPNSQKSFTARYFRTASCYEQTNPSASMYLTISSHER